MQPQGTVSTDRFSRDISRDPSSPIANKLTSQVNLVDVCSHLAITWASGKGAIGKAHGWGLELGHLLVCKRLRSVASLEHKASGVLGPRFEPAAGMDLLLAPLGGWGCRGGGGGSLVNRPMRQDAQEAQWEMHKPRRSVAPDVVSRLQSPPLPTFYQMSQWLCMPQSGEFGADAAVLPNRTSGMDVTAGVTAPPLLRLKMRRNGRQKNDAQYLNPQDLRRPI